MAIDSASSASLAPGFRFHPTDEELVRYYLRRKICGKPFRFDAISEIDIYKVEPWDLPGKSRLKSRDLEWYFFSVLDKKYGNGSKTNRATDRGYWKTTGKDRAVYHRTQIVGMKKTLVYHSGRAPRGERTNWVMHEYRLIDEELGKSGIVQDAFVLCRVFRKSGSGPKNGEQYGAPFIEEEWEDDELVMVPKDESADDGAYLDENDLEQILGTGNPCEDSPLLNISYGDNGNYAHESTAFDDAQNLLVGMGENHSGPEQPNDSNLFDLPVQYNTDANSVKHEYIGEPSNNTNSVDVDFLLDEPFLDATDKLQSDDGAFLETNDLKNPVKADPSGFDMLEDYLTFFDAYDDNTPYMPFDPSDIMASEWVLSDPTFFTDQYLNEESQQEAMAKQQQFEGQDNDIASSSKQEETEFGSETTSYKRASRILGDINAPPAFASEFPTKEAALRLNSTSSPLHVTAGMIQMRNLTLSGNGIDFSFGKHGHVDIILSFGLSRGDDDYSANSQTKANSAVSRGWFCFLFIWVMVLSLSFKIGSYICAR